MVECLHLPLHWIGSSIDKLVFSVILTVQSWIFCQSCFFMAFNWYLLYGIKMRVCLICLFFWKHETSFLFNCYDTGYFLSQPWTHLLPMLGPHLLQTMLILTLICPIVNHLQFPMVTKCLVNFTNCLPKDCDGMVPQCNKES